MGLAPARFASNPGSRRMGPRSRTMAGERRFRCLMLFWRSYLVSRAPRERSTSCSIRAYVWPAMPTVSHDLPPTALILALARRDPDTVRCACRTGRHTPCTLPARCCWGRAQWNSKRLALYKLKYACTHTTRRRSAVCSVWKSECVWATFEGHCRVSGLGVGRWAFIGISVVLALISHFDGSRSAGMVRTHWQISATSWAPLHVHQPTMGSFDTRIKRTARGLPWQESESPPSAPPAPASSSAQGRRQA